MSDLPEFQKNVYPAAMSLATQALSHGSNSKLQHLEMFEDGHFRAIFSPTYFTLREDQNAPTKSQWNTLKKRFKRINPHVFIFKEHGEIDDMYYIDFGFFEGSKTT